MIFIFILTQFVSLVEKGCDTVTSPASTPIKRAINWHFFHREWFVVLSTMDRAADKMQMNTSAD